MLAAANFAVLCAIFVIRPASCSPPFLASLTHDDSADFSQFEAPDPEPYVDPKRYYEDQKAYRLPSNAIPESYELNLIPNLSGDFRFTGNVTIKVLITEQTNNIVLHSHKLDIRSVTVTRNSRVLESSYLLQPVTQLLNITLKASLDPETRCFIAIEFEGVLNDDLVGFYRSKYVSKGQTK